MVAEVASIEGARQALDWRNTLATSGNAYLGDERNVLIAFRSAPELRGLVQFDEFALVVRLTRSPPWRKAEAGEPWGECDDTQAAAWLQSKDLRVRGKAVVADVVGIVARDATVHPLRDYLRGLRWDGTPRLSGWLESYLGAEGPALYLEAVGRAFLISAVARAMRPGVQVDHVLVFESGQGTGKTSAARILAVRPEWYAGSLPDISSKDAALQLAGRWIIEIAELRAVRSSQQEAVKCFISQTADTFRPPYGRRTAQFPRQSVFIGTTNEFTYLKDKTGNRRFWCVRCADIDLEALRRDRDQLYAEAVVAFDRGEQWHLTGEALRLAEEEQLDRVAVSELEAAVAQYLATMTGDIVTVRDVLVFGLHLNPDETGFAERSRRLGPEVSEAIVRCGWNKDRRRITDGIKQTVYRRVTGQGGQGGGHG